MEEIYKPILNKFKENSNNNIIKRKKAEEILGRLFHLPKKSKKYVLRYFKENKFINIKNKSEFEILK